VTAISVEVVYRASLLEITGAVLAAGLPGDWTVEPLSIRTEGAAKVTTISEPGTTPLSGSNLDVVRLTAAVPDEAPYGDSQAIRLENVSLNGGDIARLQFHVAASVPDAVPLAERAAYGDADPVSERPGYVVGLDIEPVDPRAGGYSWTAVDGSVAIGAPGAWHNAANPWGVDDTAGWGGTVIGHRSLEVGGRRSIVSHRTRITDYRSPVTGVDLLHVVMHEIGHLLGYGHSEDPYDLMAPVWSAPPLHPSSRIPDLATRIPDLASFMPRPSSPVDAVFADRGREGGEESGAELLESRDTDRPAAAVVRSSDGAGQARFPRKVRMARYEEAVDALWASWGDPLD